MGPQHDVPADTGSHHGAVVVGHGGGDGAGGLADAGRGEDQHGGLFGEPHLAAALHVATHEQRGALRVTVALAEDLLGPVDRGAAGEPVEVRAVGQAPLGVTTTPVEPCRDGCGSEDAQDTNGDGRVGEPAAAEAGAGDLFGGEQLAVGGQQRLQVAPGVPVRR